MLTLPLMIMLGLYIIGLTGFLLVLVVGGSDRVLPYFRPYLLAGLLILIVLLVGLYFPTRQIDLVRYAGPFVAPIDAVPHPTQSEHWYVVEQAGTIRVVEGGQVLAVPFLELGPGQVKVETFANGLLGMALHPDFEQNGLFYVYFTRPDLFNVLMRYQVMESDPDRADVNSAVVLLEIDSHDDPYHPGGDVLFGPDGYLYLTVGEGPVDENKVDHAEQSLTSYLGAVLRLDVSDPDLPAPYYTIPPDNPFLGRDDARPEIWAYGLRNPWRMTFSPDGEFVYLTDVGDVLIDEINYLRLDEAAGANFGWDYFEGREVRRNLPAGSDRQDFVFPTYEYRYQQPYTCALVGGYQYRGAAIPELQGRYIHADDCSDRLWVLYQDDDGRWIHEALIEAPHAINSLAEDQAGELYLVRGNGKHNQYAPPDEMFKLVKRWKFSGLFADWLTVPTP